jgi:hypothetical protein
MNINFIALLISALVPLVVGFVWYHPKVFGNAWKIAAGITDDSMNSGKMLVTFGVTYFLSILIALMLQFLIIHQYHFASILMNEPGLMDPSTEMGRFYADFMAKHGGNFRTFKHGALHGTMSGFLLAMPIIAINAMFDRKGFKYIVINSGYWILSFCLMGGIICSMR